MLTAVALLHTTTQLAAQSLSVLDSRRQPLANAAIVLSDPAGAIRWQCRTNAVGSAYLPEGLAGSLAVYYGGRQLTDRWPATELVLPIACDAAAADSGIDLVVVVDATGSMQPAMDFFQQQLTVLLNDLEAGAPDRSFRTGALVYRDYDERFLTLASPLNESAAAAGALLCAHRAVGGGDEAEPLAQVLDSLAQLNWRPQALARMAVLVTDAPARASIAAATAGLAAQGIAVLAIGAPGITDDAWHTLETLARHTGGEALRLPEGDIAQEALRAFLLEAVLRRTALPACSTPARPRVAGALAAYPNPASRELTLQISQTLTQLELVNAQGQLVEVLPWREPGNYTWSVATLPAGLYYLAGMAEGQAVRLPLVRQ